MSGSAHYSAHSSSASPGASQPHSQSMSVSSEPSGFLARTVIQVKASCSRPFHLSPPSTSDANSNLTTASYGGSGSGKSSEWSESSSRPPETPPPVAASRAS